MLYILHRLHPILQKTSSKHKTTATLEQSISRKKMKEQTFLAKNPYNKIWHAHGCRADILHKDMKPACKYTYYQNLKLKKWKISSIGMQP